MKARTVVGTGEKSLRGEPGSEIRLGGEKKEKEGRKHNRRGRTTRKQWYTRHNIDHEFELLI